MSHLHGQMPLTLFFSSENVNAVCILKFLIMPSMRVNIFYFRGCVWHIRGSTAEWRWGVLCVL